MTQNVEYSTRQSNIIVKNSRNAFMHLLVPTHHPNYTYKSYDLNHNVNHNHKR